MEASLVIILLASAGVGFASGRALALLFPLLAVPLAYLGLHEGWWGNGLGDGWQYPAAAVTALGLVLAAMGLFVRRASR